MIGAPPSVFTKSFVSSDTAYTNGATQTFAHGLGVAPKGVFLDAVCQVADLNFSIGDVLQIGAFGDISASNGGLAIRKDATNVYVTVAAQGIDMPNRTTFSTQFFTAASWKLRVRAVA